MARIPERLQVGPYRYSITVSTEAIDAEAVKAGAGLPGTYAGRHLPTDGKVLLAETGSPDYAAETLLHEVLHALIFASGLDLDDREEDTCSALAPLLLDTLRRQPDLLAYLLDPE